MKVKSKNTGDLHDITRKQWDTMRKRGDNRHYTIIDDTDEITQTKIEIEEISVVEFEKPEEPVDDLVFYRQALRDANIDFRWNTGLKKLKQKYEEI